MPTPPKPLTPEQERILHEGATEAPFTGAYWNDHTPGMYQCAGCGTELFSSDAKFDSGTGWPSFDRAIPGALTMKEDGTLGMRRTEIRCANCDGHLGHVFPDGPTETGERFCVNSGALCKVKEG